jgi:sulfate/thiosulfate transport system ATP-binding protein
MSIALEQVSKDFRGSAAVSDVTAQIEDGELFVLLGPSGSGKSTLLRAIAGLTPIDHGRIVLHGRDVTNVGARQREVGFVFQNYALFRHMSVARNVAFGLEIRPRRNRPSARDIKNRVASLLELMGIGDLGGRFPDQISGGQRQRVALARALAIEPALLLLDEPFGALDAKVRKTLRIWLKDLHDRIGLTSIFVTHDQAEAMEMADRVAVMRNGRIEQVDTPDHLFAEPSSAFVHEFLGEAIRLECCISQGVARFPGLSSSALPAPYRDGAAIALIRPYQIGLLGRPGPALVQSVHANGPLKRVRVLVAGQVLEVLLTAENWTPVVGQSCELDLANARIYPR